MAERNESAAELARLMWSKLTREERRERQRLAAHKGWVTKRKLKSRKKKPA